MELLGLAPGSWDVDDWFDDAPTTAVAGAPGFTPVLFQSRSASIGATHRDALATRERCTVVFGVNATEVVLNDARSAVEAIELVTLAGSRLSVMADAYVVASGGIESARLLLASDRQVDTGVGNSSGLVGRYFADHPTTPPLTLVRPVASTWALPERKAKGTFGDVLVTTRLGIDDDTQLRLGLPGFHLRMWSYPDPVGPTVVDAGVAALLNPLRPGFGEGGDSSGLQSGGRSGDIATDLVSKVGIGFDTIPNRDSRVVLSDTVRNELGERSAEVRWRLSGDDEANMQAVVALVARQLAMLGVGRLDTIAPAGTWADSVEGQHHHMGTLRMSSSSRSGVVDTDLRLHDVANLFAAGSAVFPTYGHVNPTLNIVALSLRLADHLAERVV